MDQQLPLILVVSASAYERRRVRGDLADTSWVLEDTGSADEAARFCDGDDKAVILLIDGGLLLETASEEWRTLRKLHPKLGAVVRSLAPPGSPIIRSDPSTILVDPADRDGLHEALRLLQSELASSAL